MTIFTAWAPFAMACGAPQPPRITIQTDVPDPVVIHTFRSADIPGRSNYLKRRVAELGSRLNGLTSFQMSTGFRLKVLEQGGGTGCFSLHSLDIAIRAVKFEIYIASELRPGTCSYDVTYAHEFKHAAIYSEGVRRLAARWSEALTIAGFDRPIPAASADQALRRFSKAAETLLWDIRQQETQAMTRDNALLDTPSNYRAEQRVCR